MLRLHQLKDTDGSGNEGRNVVGNFPVEEVARRTFRGYVFLLQSTTNCYFIYLVLIFLVHSGCSGERQLCWSF